MGKHDLSLDGWWGKRDRGSRGCAWMCEVKEGRNEGQRETTCSVASKGELGSRYLQGVFMGAGYNVCHCSAR